MWLFFTENLEITWSRHDKKCAIYTLHADTQAARQEDEDRDHERRSQAAIVEIATIPMSHMLSGPAMIQGALEVQSGQVSRAASVKKKTTRGGRGVGAGEDDRK
jgi:hypothetical protein